MKDDIVWVVLIVCSLTYCSVQQNSQDLTNLKVMCMEQCGDLKDGGCVFKDQ